MPGDAASESSAEENSLTEDDNENVAKTLAPSKHEEWFQRSNLEPDTELQFLQMLQDFTQLPTP